MRDTEPARLAALARTPQARAAAARIPLGPEQINRLRAAFRPMTGCPCGCAGSADPNCVTRRPIGPAVDYGQQAECGPLGWPTAAA